MCHRNTPIALITFYSNITHIYICSIIEFFIARSAYNSLFSTYITEEDMHVDVLFEREERHVIILKNNLGAAWLPQWNFNGVGEMDFGLGYQIKLDADLEVTFQGARLPAETDIELSTGWNMLGYTRTLSEDAEAALAPLLESNNLIIAKDYLGAAYLPEWNFNGVGHLKPGQGYQVKTNQSATFNYLPDHESY